jgi:hypothetical protein
MWLRIDLGDQPQPCPRHARNQPALVGSIAGLLFANQLHAWHWHTLHLHLVLGSLGPMGAISH